MAYIADVHFLSIQYINSGVLQYCALIQLLILFINGLLSVKFLPIHFYADNSKLRYSFRFEISPTQLQIIASKRTVLEQLASELSWISNCVRGNMVIFSTPKTHFLHPTNRQNLSQNCNIFEHSQLSFHTFFLYLIISFLEIFRGRFLLFLLQNKFRKGKAFLGSFWISPHHLSSLIWLGAFFMLDWNMHHITVDSTHAAFLEMVKSKCFAFINYSSLPDFLLSLSSHLFVASLFIYSRSYKRDTFSLKKTIAHFLPWTKIVILLSDLFCPNTPLTCTLLIKFGTQFTYCFP